VRLRSQTSAHHGGDIYMSGVGGDHTLLHAADLRTRLGAGDVLDALKLGSTDPADPFPLYAPGFPDPADEPVKPASCPPYRGTGAPIGTVWVEVCDTPVPNVVNWSIQIKMCDANGNIMTIDVQGPTIRGSASADPNVKAQMIKDAFESIMFPKPGEDPDQVPLFVGIGVNVPPVNVPRPGISGEVCMFVNQEVVDCGWNVDAICFSFSNWTAMIVVKPVKGWFPDVKRRMSLMVNGTAEEDAVLRISTTNGLDPDATDTVYAVPVAAGQVGPSALIALSDLINASGGLTVLDPDNGMTVVSLPKEPPPDTDGVSGPLVWEAGALGSSSLQITVAGSLARGPGSPCNPADFAEPYGELNFFDVAMFLTAFIDGDPAADLEWNGVLNFFDVSEFLQIFTGGCPKGIDG
jgi:hypothetical protein